ncbi:hypothetical protein GCM10009716_15260 [Streptomyces sodiiphilus]|uniref:CYTH domain-containing protein n=1 Tax=Streptomyces sodiiphilus TaxID=226217 RepID=A0ABP5A7U9_9ACTN
MKHEYEAKFLAVDTAGLKAKLTALGAVQALPRTLLTRKIFENNSLERGLAPAARRGHTLDAHAEAGHRRHHDRRHQGDRDRGNRPARHG